MQKRFNVSERRIEEGIVIIPSFIKDSRISKMYLLENKTAQFIWKNINRYTKRRLINKYTDTFDIDINRARKDINKFLLQLKKFHLLD